MPRPLRTLCKGDEYGRWTVSSSKPLKELVGKGGTRIRYWGCRCACGTSRLVEQYSLEFGSSLSCGCLRRERVSSSSKIFNRKHGEATGHRKSVEYRTWLGIKSRCGNPNSSTYSYYGEKGIKVCKRWEHSFENFLSDMGRKPSPYHTIERKNNNKGYSPANCTWATIDQQSKNRKRTILVTIQGRTQCVADWADEVGIPRYLVYMRLSRGWSIDRALTPKIHRGPKFKKEELAHA